MQRYRGAEGIAQVYANWPVHLPAWGALRALETAALHVENSAQMAVQAAVAAAQVVARTAVHIHAVQDAQHQQKLKRRNAKGLVHHAPDALVAVRAEVHADPNAHLHVWEDARNRAQIAVLRFAEDAVLHARQIVLLIAEIHAKIHAMGKFHLQYNDRLGHF